MPPRSIDSQLVSILACSKCRGKVTLTNNQRGLICESCRIVYPVRGGVPVMLLEEAVPLRGGEDANEAAARSESAEKAILAIVEGAGKGTKIELLRGSCRAIGRSVDDIEKTKVFSVDASINLDDASKKVVMQYLSQQFHKSPTAAPSTGAKNQEVLGGFVRGPDFQLNDRIVSRLHAMLFYDDSGSVGILDLVSRNGTYVNGAEVESKILKKGDLITIGATKIRYEV